MSTKKQSMFVMPDGRNVMFTFILVSSLFLLWGFCNGMIDVMDKHFQDELDLSKAQSAWVQFAHYLGYFLMAMPAGWLAITLGYKGGIIAGLLLVAVGRLLVHPRHQDQRAAMRGRCRTTAFAAYLAGVCAIAAGLTFLETIANPYTTVLGPRSTPPRASTSRSPATALAGSSAPSSAAMFFYATDAAAQHGLETLYIPYVIVAVVVLLSPSSFLCVHP